MKKSELQKLIREELKKSLTEATSVTVPVKIPNTFIKVFKKFLKGHQQDAAPGDSYYEMTVGKESELISELFSEWVNTTFNAIDDYELMDNFDTDLQLSDEGGYAAVLAKNGLLTKKTK